MTGEEARWAGLGPEDCEPAAAPTPVEPEENMGPDGLLMQCEGCKKWKKEDTFHYTDDGVLLCPPCLDETIKDTEEFIRENPEEAEAMGLVDDNPAAPAESQGVERAQPVEGPREHKLCCDEYHQHQAPKCCASDCWCHAAPVEGVERVTDDRPAETIPDEEVCGHVLQGRGCALDARHKGDHTDGDETWSTARAETRIEVLEAALREIRETVHRRQLPITNQVWEIADAALAAPSGDTKEKV